MTATSSNGNAEPRLGPSGEATVLLEVGATRGALIVYVPASLDDREIEIRRPQEPWAGHHTAVRRRDVRAGVRFAAVFGSLAPGQYQLRLCGAARDPALDANVRATVATEVEWPASDPDSVVVGRIRDCDEAGKSERTEVVSAENVVRTAELAIRQATPDQSEPHESP